jgi:uncharacterized protein with ParB-like and HNH nuclease domain
MTAEKIQFIDFLEGKDIQFVIPVYQRNYDWKKDNCTQLWEDLLDVLSQNRGSHFFGSIVSLTTTNSYNEREITIIDGQQRITTITLLLFAMVNLIQDNIVADSSIKPLDLLYNYLIKAVIVILG